MQSFECNTNVLGVNDWLNVCIRSQNAEMEINYLDSLQMTQGENTLNIVSNKRLNDDSISSKTKVTNQNGVHVASVIPASFFSYESYSTATVSGAVFLKLSGSRRRLAIEMDDSPATAKRLRRKLRMRLPLRNKQIDMIMCETLINLPRLLQSG